MSTVQFKISQPTKKYENVHKGKDHQDSLLCDGPDSGIIKQVF